MQLSSLLDRPGLAPRIRLLVVAAVAVWRAEWPRLRECAEVAQRAHHPRADLEEVLLQSILFCGFPRVVTAFGELTAAWPTDTRPAGGALPPDDRRAAGDALFAAIYGKNEAQVRGMLRSYHDELHEFVLDAAYGRILSRPHLDAKTRELVAVGVLAAQGQKRQFAGHARGAAHLGADRTELHEALIATFGPEPDAADEVGRWLALLG